VHKQDYKKGKYGDMIIQVPENHLSIDVSFSTRNREPGLDDDIRISFSETGEKNSKLFQCDRTSFLVTPGQAEQLAGALLKAAEQSRNTPRK
jgi:hypothetical protein